MAKKAENSLLTSPLEVDRSADPLANSQSSIATFLHANPFPSFSSLPDPGSSSLDSSSSPTPSPCLSMSFADADATILGHRPSVSPPASALQCASLPSVVLDIPSSSSSSSSFSALSSASSSSGSFPVHARAVVCSVHTSPAVSVSAALADSTRISENCFGESCRVSNRGHRNSSSRSDYGSQGSASNKDSRRAACIFSLRSSLIPVESSYMADAKAYRYMSFSAIFQGCLTQMLTFFLPVFLDNNDLDRSAATALVPRLRENAADAFHLPSVSQCDAATSAVATHSPDMGQMRNQHSEDADEARAGSNTHLASISSDSPAQTTATEEETETNSPWAVQSSHLQLSLLQSLPPILAPSTLTKKEQPQKPHFCASEVLLSVRPCTVREFVEGNGRADNEVNRTGRTAKEVANTALFAGILSIRRLAMLDAGVYVRPSLSEILASSEEDCQVGAMLYKCDEIHSRILWLKQQIRQLLRVRSCSLERSCLVRVWRGYSNKSVICGNSDSTGRCGGIYDNATGRGTPHGSSNTSSTPRFQENGRAWSGAGKLYDGTSTCEIRASDEVAADREEQGSANTEGAATVRIAAISAEIAMLQQERRELRRKLAEVHALVVYIWNSSVLTKGSCVKSKPKLHGFQQYQQLYQKWKHENGKNQHQQQKNHEQNGIQQILPLQIGHEQPEQQLTLPDFELLFCSNENDETQLHAARVLFEVCDIGNNGSISFDAVYQRLPLKALEVIFVVSEMRRKARQAYRYFWI